MLQQRRDLLRIGLSSTTRITVASGEPSSTNHCIAWAKSIFVRCSVLAPAACRSAVPRREKGYACRGARRHNHSAVAALAAPAAGAGSPSRLLVVSSTLTLGRVGSWLGVGTSRTSSMGATNSARTSGLHHGFFSHGLRTVLFQTRRTLS